MTYRRTQHGRFHYVTLPLATALFLGAWFAGVEPAASAILLLAGVLLLLVGLVFSSLTVRDLGDRLALHFGPLPLLRRELRYADVRDVRAARSDVLDGWGIHWIPRRGAIWNVWGFGCVEVELAHGRLRIGTDEPEELAAFLRERAGLDGGT